MADWKLIDKLVAPSNAIANARDLLMVASMALDGTGTIMDEDELSAFQYVVGLAHEAVKEGFAGVRLVTAEAEKP